MMQDLLLLGLLKEGPKHGYEIKKTIEEVLSIFTNVDSRSIYYPLRSLEKRGLVEKRAGRKGKRPAKFIYKITSDGQRVFERLLHENLVMFERPIFNLDLSLYFLPLVKSGLARNRLRNRLRGMNKIMQWLQDKKAELGKRGKSYHLLAIIEHQIGLTGADIKFTQNLIKDLAAGK